MGDFSAFSSKCAVYATSDDYSGESMSNPMVPERYRTTETNAPVVLKKHVLVGCMSVVLPGVTIGEGSSVGSMTLCDRSLEPWGIYVGIPARRIKDRSKKLLELEADLRITENFPENRGG